MIPGAPADARAISLVESILRSRGAIAPELIDARTIESLVRARCAAGAAASLDAYARVLQADAGEVDRLIAEIAVPETWFFRYPSSFELLRALLQPHARDRSRDVRILSVGCAGGCEPVSIAIAALSAGVAPEQLEVIAVDRNPQAVRDAQRGQWPAHSLREGLPEWAAPWISESRGDGRTGPASSARVDASALGCIRWRAADATAAAIAGPGSCAAVFCRNVLIYLDAAAREALMSRLIGALDPKGMLFLGHAESMVGRAGLESAGVPGAFAWRCVPVAPATAVPRLPVRARSTASRGPAAKSPARNASAARDPARTPVERPAAARDAHDAVRAPTQLPAAASPAAASPTAASPAASGAPHPAIGAAQAALVRGDSGAARRTLLELAAGISRGEHALHADEMELAAGLLCSVGELEAAFSLYSRIVYVNPAHDQAMLAMAEIAESRGRPEEAARIRERLRRVAARQAGKDRA